MYIGIDIGKTALHVAIAQDEHPKNYPMQIVEFRHDHWHKLLLNLIPPHAIVATEPTGHHYRAPVIQALQLRPVQPTIYQVNNATTGDVRRTYLGKAKNDKKDAQALAHIARLIAEGHPIQGVRPYMHYHAEATHYLRQLLNHRRSLIKDRTRTTNRLHQHAHAIWPILSTRLQPWMNCVRMNAITPAEIHALTKQPKPAGLHGNAWRPIVALSEHLPEGVEANQATRHMVNNQVARIDALTEEITSIEKLLSHLIEQPPFDEITAAWRTVPTMNDIGIAALHVATEGQADQFTRDQFKAAIGFIPRTSTSGSINETRSGKGGYRPAKDAIFMSTHQLLNPIYAPNPIYDYFHTGHSAAACRRKLSSILYGIARSKEPYKYGK